MMMAADIVLTVVFTIEMLIRIVALGYPVLIHTCSNTSTTPILARRSHLR
eukprot:SAG31_NODE_25783_length_454_cov_1.025352_1_plen_49_part_01